MLSIHMIRLTHIVLDNTSHLTFLEKRYLRLKILGGQDQLLLPKLLFRGVILDASY